MADTLVQRIIDRLEEEAENYHKLAGSRMVNDLLHYAGCRNATQSNIRIVREEAAKFEQEQPNA